MVCCFEERPLTLILKARLKPLAKKPPNGPMSEPNEDSATLWIWYGYNCTVSCRGQTINTSEEEEERQDTGELVSR